MIALFNKIRRIVIGEIGDDIRLESKALREHRSYMRRTKQRMTPHQIITRHWWEITQLTALLCAGFIITTFAIVAFTGV